MSPPLNKAREIRKNSQTLLQGKAIEKCLKEMGTFYYTGSYLLDLMTCNDIDMQIVLNQQYHAITEKIYRRI